VFLFLDAYHYWEQRAPKGFVCAQSAQLQPILDNFRASESLQAVAAEQGATKEFAPIPLDADGTTTHGVVFDGFRMLAGRRVRRRPPAAAGRPAASDATSIVLAYPLSCDAAHPAVGIDFVPTQDGPAMPRRAI